MFLRFGAAQETMATKTQSETKKKEILRDLLCLPNSGWAHWCHVLVNRLLGFLQDGGSRFSLEFRATLDENFMGLESSLEAEILVSNLPLYNLFVGEKEKKNMFEKV